MDFKMEVLKHLLCIISNSAPFINSKIYFEYICLPLWLNLVSQLGTICLQSSGEDRQWRSKNKYTFLECCGSKWVSLLHFSNVIFCEWQGRFLLASILKFLHLTFYEDFVQGTNLLCRDSWRAWATIWLLSILRNSISSFMILGQKRCHKE